MNHEYRDVLSHYDSGEEEDQRQSRLNPTDNRTGRRTRHRSGPGAPTPESSQEADLDSLRQSADTHREIPVFEPPIVYPVNPVDTIDPGVAEIMVQRNSPSLLELLNQLFADLSKSSNSALTQYLKHQMIKETGRFKECLNSDFYIEAISPDENRILHNNQCTVCFEVGSLSIFRCHNHHIICGSCQKSLIKMARQSQTDGFCPTCRSPGIPCIKMTEYEEWLNNIHVYCNFRDLGCKFETRIRFLGDHILNTCRERRWSCFFCDELTSLGNFYQHFIEKHVSIFGKHYKYDFLDDSRTIVRIPLKGDEHDLAFLFFSIDGAGHFIVVQVKVDGEKFIYFALKMDSAQESNKFQVHIKIKYRIPKFPLQQIASEFIQDVYSGQNCLRNILETLGDLHSNCDPLSIATLDMSQNNLNITANPDIKLVLKFHNRLPDSQEPSKDAFSEPYN